MPQRLGILAAMTAAEIATGRLHHQLVTGSVTTSPTEVVRALLAMQGQDYLASLWAVAVRTPDATERAVEEALERRELVRTWPMRGTLHLMAAEDARWMTELLTPKVITGLATRHRQLGLDEAMFDRCRAAFEEALHGGRQITRPDAHVLLDGLGVPATQARSHLLGVLCMRCVLVGANRQGKQPTFALFEEWAPAARSLPREEALAQLARRYFTSH